MIPPLPAPSSELKGLLSSTYQQVPRDWRDRFSAHFLGLYEQSLKALLIYGSYLSPSLRKPTSFPDFIVVTGTRRAASLTLGQRILYPFLPPHALSSSIPAPDGVDLPCKYYVLAEEDFEQATSSTPSDLSIAGRLSKCIGILHTSDETARQSIMDACARSMVLNGALALPFLNGPFNLDAFAVATLNVSYLAEFRMTEAGKVQSIFDAEAAFYREAFSLVLSQLRATGFVENHGVGWSATPDSVALRALAKDLINRSRRNGKWRLAKYILLFRDWTHYLVDKIDRSQGERIELTPLQRRLPLLFAWGHFFRLLKQGRLR